jgi:hypothetical protein
MVLFADINGRTTAESLVKTFYFLECVFHKAEPRLRHRATL